MFDLFGGEVVARDQIVAQQKLKQRWRKWWCIVLSFLNGVIVLVLGVVVIFFNGVVLGLGVGRLLLIVIVVHGFDVPTIVVVIVVVFLLAAFVLRGTGGKAWRCWRILLWVVRLGVVTLVHSNWFQLFLRLGDNRVHSCVRRRGSEERFHLVDGFLSHTLGGGTMLGVGRWWHGGSGEE
jgi:hypothetical protein